MMDKIKDNKILNTIIELILIIIIIFLLLHNCNLQKEKNKKKPTGNVDIIEIKCDNIETCTIDKDNKQNDTKQSTSILPVINKEEQKEEVKEIEPDTGLVVVDNHTVNWNGKKDLKIFTNSMYELTDRISPESSSTYKFVVKNKTEYDLKYKITFIETNENKINMKYKLRKNNDYIIDTYTSYQNLNLQNQEISKGENDTYYLDWKWISSENDTCSSIYLIESYISSTDGGTIQISDNSYSSQFGVLSFNKSNNSLSDVGYMYNKRYGTAYKQMQKYETMYNSTSLSTNYAYAHNVVWGTPTANKYNLDNGYKISSTGDYQNLVGEYTLKTWDVDSSDSKAYYIAGVSGSNMYYILLGDTTNHSLSDLNDIYTYSDSYKNNNDGTYTIINDPKTITRAEWFKKHSSVEVGSYVCKNAVDNTCSDLMYVTIVNPTNFNYISISDVYKYSKGFVYKLDTEDNTYKYFLNDDTAISFWNIKDDTNMASLNNAHYTCFNDSGKCTKVYYIHQLMSNGREAYYTTLTDGKSIEDALSEMLYDSNINTTNSIIKTGVEAWYKKYLYNNYDSYIEDTIYCNDRSIKNLNGWNSDGGNLKTELSFKASSNDADLSCTNNTDKFSVSNNNAKLKYKVGLLSYAEISLSKTAKSTEPDESYWLISPRSFNATSAYGSVVTANGTIDITNSPTLIYNEKGVRPVISLVPGLEYSTGNGSKETPYIVDLNSVGN